MEIKMDKDLNKFMFKLLETVKLLEENIGNKLLDDFLDLTPKAMSTKAKINKWDYIKLKTSTQQRKSSIK